MTAAGGDPGETPHNEHVQPQSGGYEPPPTDPNPAYGGYPPPQYGAPQPQYGAPQPQYGAPQPQYGAPYPPPPGGYIPPPEYGAPYPTGYGYPSTPPTGTNSMAVFSLVASVVGLLCGIGSIIGIGLGAIAINQIKKTGQGGYGLAVAGIVVGVASLVISVVWMTYAWN
jgi:hypothetical protein